MADHLTRRSFMQSASIASLALPAAAVPLAALTSDDPLLALLLKKRSLLADLNRSSGDIADDDPRLEELEAVECAMIGLPALTTVTALLALEVVIEEVTDFPASEVDLSLLGAVKDHFGSLSSGAKDHG